MKIIFDELTVDSGFYCALFIPHQSPLITYYLAQNGKQ